MDERPGPIAQRGWIPQRAITANYGQDLPPSPDGIRAAGI